MIAICCSWFPSEQEKSFVRSVIEKAFHDSKKVYITWFENGDLVVNPHDLINFFTPYPFPQQPTAAAAADCPRRDITGKQPFSYPWDYKIYVPSGKTVFALTRIRKGIISDLSNRREDVQYWKPGFIVPCEIKDDLYTKNSNIPNAELSILMAKEGYLTCQVKKKDGIDWQNLVLLDLDETVVLQTQLRHGKISFHDKDLVIHKGNLRVPKDKITSLEQNYKETPTADLFITSDPKGNSRCIVKLGASSKVFTFINKLYNQAVGQKENLF